MKKIFVLQSTYYDSSSSEDYEEVNCVSTKRESIEKMIKFLKEAETLENLTYKSSKVDEYEVEDDVNVVQIGEQELMII